MGECGTVWESALDLIAPAMTLRSTAGTKCVLTFCTQNIGLYGENLIGIPAIRGNQFNFN